jgi:hypothetical protein
VDQIQDEEYAFAALRTGPGGQALLQSIYLWQEEAPALAWHFQP